MLNVKRASRGAVACALCILATGCGTDAPPELVVDSPELELVEGERGRIAFVATDPDGDAVTTRVDGDAPLTWSIDAEGGVLVEAPWGFAGEARATVIADDATGQSAEVAVRVVVRALTWTDRAEWREGEGPEEREHATVIVDSARRRVLLFGGSGYTPYGELLEDAWSYSLDERSFSPLEFEGSLPVGVSRRAAVTEPGTAYLFGGLEESGATNALVRVDFAHEVVRFETVAQEGPPPARALHAFVYDAAAATFYAFGGLGAGLYGDVWRMRLDEGGARWTELALGAGPDPRYGFFYAFDEIGRRLVVFSGARGRLTINPGRDLWALELSGEAPTWRLLLEGEALPEGRRNGTTVYEPGRARLLVFGGTADGLTASPGLFLFDLLADSAEVVAMDRESAPPARSSGFGWHDPDTGTFFLGFGNTAEEAFRDVATLSYR